jgi:hypothetical protein
MEELSEFVTTLCRNIIMVIKPEHECVGNRYETTLYRKKGVFAIKPTVAET